VNPTVEIGFGVRPPPEIEFWTVQLRRWLRIAQRTKAEKSESAGKQCRSDGRFCFVERPAIRPRARAGTQPLWEKELANFELGLLNVEPRHLIVLGLDQLYRVGDPSLF
jgi:hypothetical protein